MKLTSFRSPDKPADSTDGVLRRYTVARIAHAAAHLGTDREHERSRLREVVIGLHLLATPRARAAETVLRGAAAGVGVGRIVSRLGAEALAAAFLHLPREAEAILDGGGRTLARLRDQAADLGQRRAGSLLEADARAVRAAELVNYAEVLGIPIIG